MHNRHVGALQRECQLLQPVPTLYKRLFHDEDRKKNAVLFGLGEKDNESLKDKVSKVLLEVNQKPRLRQVVRLGQPKGNQLNKIHFQLNTILILAGHQ